VCVIHILQHLKQNDALLNSQHLCGRVYVTYISCVCGCVCAKFDTLKNNESLFVILQDIPDDGTMKRRFMDRSKKEMADFNLPIESIRLGERSPLPTHCQPVHHTSIVGTKRVLQKVSRKQCQHSNMTSSLSLWSLHSSMQLRGKEATSIIYQFKKGHTSIRYSKYNI
jgi:hypothetical protein